MQIASLGFSFLNMFNFFILPNKHVFFIILFFPLFLKPQGLTVGLSKVLVNPRVSYDSYFAGFQGELRYCASSSSP
jgi:hypothetical protein